MLRSAQDDFGVLGANSPRVSGSGGHSEIEKIIFSGIDGRWTTRFYAGSRLRTQCNRTGNHSDLLGL